MPASAKALFAYHEQPGALKRLIPPWENAKVLSASDGIRDGSRVQLQFRKFGIPLTWKALHSEYSPPTLFVDTQLSGPFRFWQHRHMMHAANGSQSTLTDRIEYEPPLGVLGRSLLGGMVRRQVDSMFQYRHEVTRLDLELANQLAGLGVHSQRCIAITGVSGMVGGRLASLLSVLGHRVISLERPKKSGRAIGTLQSSDNFETLEWRPEQGVSESERLEGIDAVVHLAGANIAGKRWNDARKRALWESRVLPTERLATQLSELTQPPKAFVTASGVGIYGDRGPELLNEESEVGHGFLPELAQAWESATDPAKNGNTRVCHARFGIILDPKEGALAKMLPIFKMGGGGRLGSGDQWMAWIHLDDAVAALLWLCFHRDANGPVNVTAPQSLQNREFTTHLGKALGRPTILPAPAAGLRLVLGEMADGLLLASNRVVPERLEQLEMPYRYRTLPECFKALLPSVGN